MKRFLLLFFIIVASFAKAQQIDSIFFHLYADSLKKGPHNYINVDGKLGSGHYLPLTDKQLIFWSNAGTWEGNNLIIDTSLQIDSVLIKTTLRSNPALSKSIVVYIKKSKYEGELKSENDLFNKRNKEKDK